MRKLMKLLDVEPQNIGLLNTIFYSFLVNGMISISLGSILPYIKAENNLTYAQSGLMLSAHQVGNLSAVLIAGFLPYIWGKKQSAVVMGAGMALGILLLTITKNPLFLVIAFGLTGIGRGTMSNVCNVVVSDVVKNKASGLNILHSIFAIGALLSPILLIVMAKIYSWRGATVAMGVLGIIAVIALGLSKLSSSPSPKEKDGAFAFLKGSEFWINTLILCGYMAAEASIIGWFVIYFVDTGVLTVEMAKLTPMLLWATVMIGRMACAWLSKLVDKSQLLLIIGVGFILCFGGLLLSHTTLPCIIFLLGIGLTMGGIYPTTIATMQGTSNTIQTGFVIAGSNVGAIVMPSVVGNVADHYGMFGGVTVVLGALAVMVVLMIIKYIGSRKNNQKVNI